MKLFCLGLNPNSACFLLKFQGITILLDCGLELSNLLRFLPISSSNPSDDATHRLKDAIKNIDNSFSSLFHHYGNYLLVDSIPKYNTPEFESMIDMEKIDAILISNYHNMLALPFITEYTKFRGKIYATEPTIQIGSRFMEELLQYHSQVNNQRRDNKKWQDQALQNALSESLKDQLRGSHRWVSLYNQRDIEKCTSKIQSVTFQQHIGLFSLKLIPVSSGYCLGSANWIITNNHEKIVYISDSTMSNPKHPEPLNTNELKKTDVLILTKVTTESHSPETMFTDMCHHLGATLSNGGNVVIPIYSSGFILDLFELIHTYLAGSGLSYIPMYFISPVAEYLLAYSNIAGEWLCKARQEKLYMPEAPFLHEDMVKNGQLIHVSDISKMSSALKEPCIVFCGHPSLRFGPVTHFLSNRVWGGDSKNSIIFVEPDFDHQLAIAPFQGQGLAMRVFHCPLDARINFTEANKLIKELSPKRLIIPHTYTSASDGNENSAAKIAPYSGITSTMRQLDILSFPLKSQFTSAFLAEPVALDLRLHSLHKSKFGAQSGDVLVGNVSGTLETHNHEYHLSSIDKTPKKQYLFGRPTLETILHHLQIKGIANVQVDKKSETESMVHLSALRATIHLTPEETTVTVRDEATRQTVKSIFEDLSTFVLSSN